MTLLFLGCTQTLVAPEHVDYRLRVDPLVEHLELEREHLGVESEIASLDAALDEAARALLERTSTRDIREAELELWRSGDHTQILEAMTPSWREGLDPNLVRMHAAWRWDVDLGVVEGEPDLGPPKPDREPPPQQRWKAPDFHAASVEALVPSIEDAEGRIALRDTVSDPSAALLADQADDLYTSGRSKHHAFETKEAASRLAYLGPKDRRVPALYLHAAELEDDPAGAADMARKIVDAGGPPDEITAQALYALARHARTVGPEHLGTVLEPLVFYERAQSEPNPVRLKFALLEAANMRAVLGREVGSYRAEAAAIDAEVPPTSGPDLSQTWETDCAAPRTVSYFADHETTAEGNACTAINYEQMCFDDVSGCTGQVDTCEVNCGEPCLACEVECAASCETCEGDHCLSERAMCSDLCVQRRAACFSDCREANRGCWDAFDATRAELCPDCSQMHSCVHDQDCQEKFPGNAPECGWWCFQP